MAENQANLRKKQQRRNNTSKKRQAVFVSEYVFVKYFAIYQEAAQLFNQINTVHPKKPDLRTSFEFKNWKRQQAGLPKLQPHKKRDPVMHTTYHDISVNQSHNDVQGVPEGDKNNILQIIESLPKKAMQLRIPLLDEDDIGCLIPNDNDQVVYQVLEEGNNHQVPEEGNNHQVPEEGNNHQVPEEGNNHQVSEGGNNDQVLEEGNNDQVPEEGNEDEVHSIQPSLLADISQETMEELLAELQADPNLAAIMDDFETYFNDIDHELDIGMEVEIDDRLESEIEVFL